MGPVQRRQRQRKSFIFALGDDWKEVAELCSKFQKHAKDTGASETQMNHIQAADFLQRHGKTRRP